MEKEFRNYVVKWFDGYRVVKSAVVVESPMVSGDIRKVSLFMHDFKHGMIWLSLQ